MHRLRFYLKAFTFLLLLISIGWTFQYHKSQGVILHAPDFTTFWSAGYLAATGNAGAAYTQQINEFVPNTSSGNSGGWFYPPMFQLVVLPLGLIPFPLAYCIFIFSSLACFILVIRKIASSRDAMWCLAGFSGIWLNLILGQNGLLTGAIATLALLNFERKPALSGLIIALLAIKPHLALLFPVALIAAGAWGTIITAIVATIAFTSISFIALGGPTFIAWFQSIGYAKTNIESPGFWSFSPSIFASLRTWGVPEAWAYIGQAALAVVSAVIVWNMWRRCRSMALRGASLMTGTLLVSPYIFAYDLVWLAAPIAWLAVDCMENGWIKGEREMLVIMWLLPLFIAVMNQASIPLQISPFMLLAFLLIIYRRARIKYWQEPFACSAKEID